MYVANIFIIRMKIYIESDYSVRCQNDNINLPIIYNIYNFTAHKMHIKLDLHN